MNRQELEALVRQLLTEKLDNPVKFFSPEVQITERDRLSTGNPADRVYTHDLFSLSQSPRLGVGVMVMDKSDFAWHLDYDEVDFVLDGVLTIRKGKGEVTAHKGEGIFIPKGTDIFFSAPDHARFLYVTYPADWQKSPETSF